MHGIKGLLIVQKSLTTLVHLSNSCEVNRTYWVRSELIASISFSSAYLATKFLSLELGESGCFAAGPEEVVTIGTGKL